MDPMTGASSLGSTQGIQTASQGMVGLDSEAFMNLLVAQLRYQDPMSPTDSNALMQQTSVLAQTELLTSVSEMQQQLLGLQRANIATDLIGQQVEGVSDGGATVSGVVDGVRFEPTGPVLLIGDQQISIDNATSIGSAAGTTTTTTGEPSGSSETDSSAS
ncbi:MAG: flagellar basal-body rod modification protein FlgD [Nitriliruptoraceae bacterium]|jgi:flagellar basal-body rod modification protein FlgD